MSARDRIRDWTRRLFRRRERDDIDLDARRQFEQREEQIAAALMRLQLSNDVRVGRYRPNADRMHR